MSSPTAWDPAQPEEVDKADEAALTRLDAVQMSHKPVLRDVLDSQAMYRGPVVLLGPQGAGKTSFRHCAFYEPYYVSQMVYSQLPVVQPTLRTAVDELSVFVNEVSINVKMDFVDMNDATARLAIHHASPFSTFVLCFKFPKPATPPASAPSSRKTSDAVSVDLSRQGTDVSQSEETDVVDDIVARAKNVFAKHPRAPIFIVGTHLDKVSDEYARTFLKTVHVAVQGALEELSKLTPHHNDEDLEGSSLAGCFAVSCEGRRALCQAKSFPNNSRVSHVVQRIGEAVYYSCRRVSTNSLGEVIGRHLSIAQRVREEFSDKEQVLAPKHELAALFEEYGVDTPEESLEVLGLLSLSGIVVPMSLASFDLNYHVVVRPQFLRFLLSALASFPRAKELWEACDGTDAAVEQLDAAAGYCIADAVAADGGCLLNGVLNKATTAAMFGSAARAVYASREVTDTDYELCLEVLHLFHAAFPMKPPSDDGHVPSEERDDSPQRVSAAGGPKALTSPSQRARPPVHFFVPSAVGRMMPPTLPRLMRYVFKRSAHCFRWFTLSHVPNSFIPFLAVALHNYIHLMDVPLPREPSAADPSDPPSRHAMFAKTLWRDGMMCGDRKTRVLVYRESDQAIGVLTPVAVDWMIPVIINAITKLGASFAGVRCDVAFPCPSCQGFIANPPPGGDATSVACAACGESVNVHRLRNQSQVDISSPTLPRGVLSAVEVKELSERNWEECAAMERDVIHAVDRIVRAVVLSALWPSAAEGASPPSASVPLEAALVPDQDFDETGTGAGTPQPQPLTDSPPREGLRTDTPV